jgi:hypothetical protein
MRKDVPGITNKFDYALKKKEKNNVAVEAVAEELLAEDPTAAVSRPDKTPDSGSSIDE